MIPESLFGAAIVLGVILRRWRAERRALAEIRLDVVQQDGETLAVISGPGAGDLVRSWAIAEQIVDDRPSRVVVRCAATPR